MLGRKRPAGTTSAETVSSEKALPERVSSGKASTTGTGQASTEVSKASEASAAGAETTARQRWRWPRLTVIIVFAFVYAYDLFEAISDTFGVSAQIGKYNENATLIGINTIAVPWAVLVANLLVPVVVFFFAMLVARKRNFGILALIFLAGLGVVAALSLSLTVLAGALTR